MIKTRRKGFWNDYFIETGPTPANVLLIIGLAIVVGFGIPSTLWAIGTYVGAWANWVLCITALFSVCFLPTVVAYRNYQKND